MMRLFFLSMLLLTTSCASLGDKFKPVAKTNSDKALLYVYRVHRFTGSAGSPYVCINDQVVGEIPDGGYFPVEIQPGQHQVSLKSLGEELVKTPFQARAGQTYYLRMETTASKKGTGTGLVMDSMLANSDEEKKAILASLDTRAQKNNDDPGFIFVKESFALNEIKKNKIFNVPKYEKNYCGKLERKSAKKRR
ncbi:MAG: DUF2846 domain-containing protein [Bdellovibrionales bacterium]|nr:DUF2846 domain-containing protein [Bdellovibrionales bacterium]